MRRRMMMSKKNEDKILPSDYVRLNYIESTGTQYINTGYVNSGNYSPYKIEAEYQFTETSTTNISTIFGTARTTGNTYPFFFGSREKLLLGHFGNSGLMCKFGISDTNKHTVKYVFGEGVYIDDIFQVETQEQCQISSNSMKNIGLFATIKDTTPSFYAKAKIYSCKFYERNDVLVRDFIPARRISDNKIGLYDLIEGKFYTNNGTGEFKGG